MTHNTQKKNVNGFSFCAWPKKHFQLDFSKIKIKVNFTFVVWRRYTIHNTCVLVKQHKRETNQILLCYANKSVFATRMPTIKHQWCQFSLRFFFVFLFLLLLFFSNKCGNPLPYGICLSTFGCYIVTCLDAGNTKQLDNKHTFVLLYNTIFYRIHIKIILSIFAAWQIRVRLLIHIFRHTAPPTIVHKIENKPSGCLKLIRNGIEWNGVAWTNPNANKCIIIWGVCFSQHPIYYSENGKF